MGMRRELGDRLVMLDITASEFGFDLKFVVSRDEATR
jgi:hypothetical protein